LDHGGEVNGARTNAGTDGQLLLFLFFFISKENVGCALGAVLRAGWMKSVAATFAKKARHGS
jgi:hypothetical protein